jgi:hypothetical protein
VSNHYDSEKQWDRLMRLGMLQMNAREEWGGSISEFLSRIHRELIFFLLKGCNNR